MSNSRYEEYSSFDSLPFVLWWKLFRSTTHSAHAANWHENLEIQCCNKGEGYVLLDGKRYNIKEGDIIVANSNTLHFTGTDSEIWFSALIIDTSFCKDIGIDYANLLFEPLIRNDNIVQLFKNIYEMMHDEENICRVANLKKYAIELMIELRTKHTQGTPASTFKNSSFSTVKEAITYIQKNFTTHFSLDDMATALFVDKCNLIKKFKRHTGNTIIKYTNTLRCEKAKLLIAAGTPIFEAARSCGFNNMSYFTRTFRTCLGKNPSEYKPTNR